MPDGSVTDLRLSSEDSEGSLSTMTASSTALAAMIATNSVTINTSATSSGCFVHIRTSHASDPSDSGYLDMQYNQTGTFLIKNVWNFSNKPPLGYTFPYRSFGDKQ
jgi:hypothetical protein